MIIIAIPKSASSSLMVTLGRYHNMTAKQDFSFKSNNPPENCRVLHNLHSDIRELTLKDFENICKNNQFNKQHIYPSPNNVSLFSDIKKVILLRNPDEIIPAYRRAKINRFSRRDNFLPGYDLEMSENEWLERSKKDGLYEDLDFFFNEWKIKAKTENTLFIDYLEYIMNPKSVINKIERFYNLPVTKGKLKAIKVIYTRRSLVGNILFRFRRKTARILYSFIDQVKV